MLVLSPETESAPGPCDGAYSANEFRKGVAADPMTECFYSLDGFLRCSGWQVIMAQVNSPGVAPSV